MARGEHLHFGKFFVLGLGMLLGGLLGDRPGFAQGCPGINGDDGDNELVGTSCGETIKGHQGNDVIRAAGGNDLVFGNDGDDQMFGDEGDDRLIGGTGNDLFEGGPGDDRLEDEGGSDRLFGQAGNDLLLAGSSNDYLDGGPGDDILRGGAADDFLDDAEGFNTLDGQTERDTIVGRSGSGILRGGSGDDFIVIVGNSIAGYQSIEGGSGDDLLFFATDANPEMVEERGGELFLRFDLRTQQPVEINLADVVGIEAVVTGDGDDMLIGTDRTGEELYGHRLEISVHEILIGADGNDVIKTLGGNDYVDGGPGNDTLHLGNGNHYLTGGGGRDTFIWTVEDLAGSNASRITDLDSGDIVQWQGDWQTSDVTVEAIQIDGQEAASVHLRGVEKLTLEGVGPEDVRVRRAREAVWLDVQRSNPRQGSTSKSSSRNLSLPIGGR